MGDPTIRSLSFLMSGNFPDGDPYAGLEDTLGLFEFGERAGFDGAWIRQRHLEHEGPAAAVFRAAASAHAGSSSAPSPQHVRRSPGVSFAPERRGDPRRGRTALNLLAGSHAVACRFPST